MSAHTVCCKILRLAAALNIWCTITALNAMSSILRTRLLKRCLLCLPAEELLCMRRPKSCMSKTGSRRLAGRSGHPAGGRCPRLRLRRCCAHGGGSGGGSLGDHHVHAASGQNPLLVVCLLWQERPCSIHDRCKRCCCSCCFAGIRRGHARCQ